MQDFIGNARKILWAEMNVDDLEDGAKQSMKLVKALQDEYFCDDVSPPPEASGWSEQALRDFMESGGESVEAMPIRMRAARLIALWVWLSLQTGIAVLC